jgi:hypothetical protein
MARSHAAAKTKRTSAPKEARLTLVPAASPPRVEAEAPRCLVLQGLGHPDCPEFFIAVEAMEAVAHVLRGAMERAGRIGEDLGMTEKSWTYRRDEGVWQWKVRVLVPNSITATLLELAKHLAGRNPFVEPICLVPVCGYTVH